VLRPSYPIETARLLLRPFREGDFEDLFAIQSRPDVARYLYGEPSDAEETRRSLEEKIGHAAIESEGDRLNLVAELRAGGAMAGYVTLIWRSAQHGEGEVGFIFHPDYQGRALATEAAEAMLSLGFEELGLHRIVGECDARNSASARVLERLGMRREAHLVENEFVKGEWASALIYAMLDREWRARRE
jgi:RimJ/RimL family protein N-acetyltransferase